MRQLTKENLELMQQTLKLLGKTNSPVSQPELAHRLNVSQPKMWKIITSLLFINKIVSLPKSQYPQLFNNRKEITYLFRSRG